MKKGIIFIIAILIVIGCADKKKHIVKDTKNGTDRGAISNNRTVNYGNSGDINAYGGYTSSNNVDPYGSGNYGTNNGTYNDGAFGNNSSYAGDNIKNIYFDIDQYNITSDKLHIIHSNSLLLKSKIDREEKIKIEGNCDASGSDEYNYALGLRRAKAVKDAIIDEGIKRENIILVSLGESSPECSESSTASCYAKNRRVEFKIIPSSN